MDKKLFFPAFLCCFLAAGFVLVSCDNGTTGGGGGDYTLFSGTSGGKAVEIKIAQTANGAKSIVATTGEYYTVKYGGVIVDRGTVETSNDEQIVFKSSNTVAGNNPTFTLSLELTKADPVMNMTSIDITEGANKGDPIVNPIITATTSPDLQGSWIGDKGSNNYERLTVNGNAGVSEHSVGENGPWALYARATINFNGTRITFTVTDTTDEDHCPEGITVPLILASDKQSFSMVDVSGDEWDVHTGGEYFKQ